MNRVSCSVQWSEKDEAFIAICPELAGVSALGDTLEEALTELGTVIDLTLETYVEKG